MLIQTEKLQCQTQKGGMYMNNIGVRGGKLY